MHAFNIFEQLIVFIVRLRPLSTLFPYTTLFRSGALEVRDHLSLRRIAQPGDAADQHAQLDPRSGGGHRRPQTDLSSRRDPPARSEEHTSELQSRLHLVCRLLLEKKNKPIFTGKL